MSVSRVFVQVKKSDIHFGAFLKAKGAEVVEASNFGFKFDITNLNKSIGELKLEHSNSEALKIDRELLNLKKLTISH